MKTLARVLGCSGAVLVGAIGVDFFKSGAMTVGYVLIAVAGWLFVSSTKGE